MEFTDFNSTNVNNITIHLEAQSFHFIDFIIKIRWHMYVIVYPLVALYGILGNSICIVVLIKSGLKKPSNVLLTSLCVADSCVLISYINIPFLMSFIPGRRPYYVSACEFPEQVCLTLFYLAISMQFFTTYGENVSASIVSFITVERLIAVFYPLYFKLIVTTKRVWLIVCLAYILWTPWPVYYTTLYEFQYKYIIGWDVYLGLIAVNITDVTMAINRGAVTPMGLYVPVSIITAGSLLIALQVNLTVKKRRQIVSTLTKSKVQSSKSTRLLLTVCVVFIITKIPNVLSNLDFYNSSDEKGVGIYFILQMVSYLMQTLNSASNFIIYVGLNKKFRKTLKTIMKC